LNFFYHEAASVAYSGVRFECWILVVRFPVGSGQRMKYDACCFPGYVPRLKAKNSTIWPGVSIMWLGRVSC